MLPPWQAVRRLHSFPTILIIFSFVLSTFPEITISGKSIKPPSSAHVPGSRAVAVPHFLVARLRGGSKGKISKKERKGAKSKRKHGGGKKLQVESSQSEHDSGSEDVGRENDPNHDVRR
jgi:hypothetical protein